MLSVDVWINLIGIISWVTVAFLILTRTEDTRKTAEFDDFHRDWPNIIVSDAATISAVDKKWATLGLGPFIKSPSLKYRDQIYSEGASVE